MTASPPPGTPPSGTPPRGTPPGTPTKGEPARQPDRERLYDAWSKVVDEAREKAAEARAPKPTVGRGAKPYIAGVLVLACVAAWGLAPIATVVTPADPPEVRTAGLRVALYVVGKRIEGHRQARGQLPTTLAELGSTPAGVTYLRLDTDRYELVAVNGADRVVYHSNERLEDFLGNAPSFFRRTSLAPPAPR